MEFPCIGRCDRRPISREWNLLGHGKRLPFHRRLVLEPLERRTLLDGSGVFDDALPEGHNDSGPKQSWLVSTAVDENDGDHGPGDLSLREALVLAAVEPGDDVIRFDVARIGNRIDLDPPLGELSIDSNVDIQGPGMDRLVVAGSSRARVFRVAEEVTASISGMTVTGGQRASGEDTSGAGISNAGTLSIDDVAISGNEVSYYYYREDKSPECGAGLYNTGRLTVTNCTISDNLASYYYYEDDDKSVASGGGVYNEGAMTIVDSTISANKASYYRYYYDDKSNGSGGGIYNAGTLEIVNSTISGNEASYYRYHNDDKSLGSGGGISNDGAMILTNATVSGNAVSYFYFYRNDKPDAAGGGIQTEAGTALLANTIVADNFRTYFDTTTEDDVAGEFERTSSHNLIGIIDGSTGLDGNDTLYGTAQSPLRARLGPLQDNGGPTPTQALLSGSPALEAGSNVRAQEAGITHDQRGFPRLVDADQDGTATVDVGAYEFWGIAGGVWEDLDRDGIQDLQESGAGRVTVRLLDADLSLLDTTTTNHDGSYAFAGLNPGQYSLEFVAFADVDFSPQDQGGDDTRDSDVDPASGRTAAFLLGAGEGIDRDAGLSGPVAARLGDLVWEDDDGDGVQDPGETGVQGATVRLVDEHLVEIAATTTAADGSYDFAKVWPGEYLLEVLPPNDFVLSPMDRGDDDLLDSDVSPSSGLTAAFTLSAGDLDLSRDAGVYRPVTITGDVWEDLDSDGIREAGETGGPGVTVRLLDATLAPLATATTDPEDDYEFSGLPPGEYSLEFAAAEGMAFTARDQGDDALDSDADPATGRTEPVTLTSGGSADFDAGFSGPVTGQIGDLVWEDSDGDGIRDPGEGGLSGVDVILLGGDDRQIDSTTTAMGGSYSFTELWPWEYSLQFNLPWDLAISPMDQGDDDLVDSDADPNTGRTERFVLAPQQQIASRDAGAFRLASIGGYVWDDSNRDGIQSGAEGAVAEITVRLLDVDFSEVAATTTRPDGTYVFADQQPGRYVLEFVASIGTSFSPADQGGDDSVDSDAAPATGRTAPFAVTSGQQADLDAGLFGPLAAARVSGTVWRDVNANGIRQPEEAPLGGVSVGLLDENLTQIATRTTAPDGTYSFAGLSPGWYSVQLTAPDGTTFAPISRGDDELLDSDVNRSTGRTVPSLLISGQDYSAQDAGICVTPGTNLVKDVWPGEVGSGAAHLTEVGGTLFFAAADGIHGHELWKSDGTPDGTVMVKDILPGSGGSTPYYLTNVGGTLMFVAEDETRKPELWRSDGTSEGTVMVKGVWPGNGWAYPRDLTDIDGTLYFSAGDDVHGRELWKSDGTPDGTMMVKDIFPGNRHSSPDEVVSMGGVVFFRANDGVNGSELWKTDGTAAGTVMVADIHPGYLDSGPDDLIAIGSTLFFAANDGNSGSELWKSDGTQAGTLMVRDIRPGGNGSGPDWLTDLGGTLMFAAYGAGGDELWKSDGTQAGTVLVKDINPGGLGSDPGPLIDVGGTLFFSAEGVYGTELWKSDGTANGTLMVADIRPGAESSHPDWPTDVNGTLFFSANDGDSGWELWKSDGTPEGTAIVKDITQGIDSSSPRELTVVDDTLFFAARDRWRTGRELFKSDGTSLNDLRNSLRITEIAHRWPNFIELKNTGPDPLDLSGVRFIDGVAFDFTYGQLGSLFPGEFVLVVDSVNAFSRSYDAGEINLAGEYAGGLENTGERIELVAPINKSILEFSYDPDWFALTESGRRYTFTVIDETAPADSWDSRSNWRPGSLSGGSPGADDPRLTPDPGAVVINEIMTNSADGYSDWIELYNTTDADVDLGGWWMGDDDRGGDPRFYSHQIPPGTVIPAGGYVTFTRGDDFDFGLSSQGERLQLTAGELDSWELLGYSESVRFGGAEVDVTFGRCGDDFTAMAEPTMGGPNSAAKVGPVVINEVMYHPAYLHDEFLELYNTTPYPLDVGGWTLDGIGSYDLPPGTVIPVGGFALVVPIGPAVFRYKYAIASDVPIAGPYGGTLSNAGDDLRLYKYDEDDRQILVDRVDYDDELPWPEEADRGGGSLERIVARRYGNHPANWDVTAVLGGTPGRGNSIAAAQIVGRHVFYNNSAFDGNDPSANRQDDEAIAVDKHPLMPGQTATFANYTSFSRGINGIMIDVAGLPDWAAPAADDFVLKVGNDDDFGAWTDAPLPANVTLRKGAGFGGADRITIVWEDNLIQKQWLQVTVLPDGNVALAEPDVFYFGNAVGETGDSTIDAKVNAHDMLSARDNQRSFLNPAPIDFVYDFNRDKRVNTVDMLIARNNQTHLLNVLRLITVQSGKDNPQSTTALRQEPAHDAVLRQADGNSWRPDTALDKLDWLYEFEPITARRQDPAPVRRVLAHTTEGPSVLGGPD